MQCTINTPITLPFTSVNLVTGLVSFTPRFTLDGILVVITPLVYAEIGGGLYTIHFTPTASGELSLFIEHILYPAIEVVSVTNTVILQNIVDESLGSWTWDKVSGVLTLIRQSGTTMATFNVVDTISNASRERIS